jgi:glycosyltransferase involved in cell wall biosynthesis
LGPSENRPPECEDLVLAGETQSISLRANQAGMPMSDAAVSARASTELASARSIQAPVEPAKIRLAILGDAGHINIQRWCEGLTRAGADVHVLSFRDGEKKGWQVHLLPASRLPGKLHYLASVPYVRRLIRSIEPHLLVSYYVTGYGTLGALTGFRPIVQVTSGSDLLVAVRNPIMQRIIRHNLSRADLVTAWAPHMAKAALENGASATKLMALPRGIPFERFAAQRCKKPSNQGVVRIVSTRSLRPDYNIDTLLQAADLLRKDRVQFTMTLAGEGPQQRELLSQCDALGLNDCVQFSGFVSNDRLPSVLAEHDVYVSLSPSDGVSASLLEAMAVGLFPIVPNHPANRLWIEHESNGLLLDRLSAPSVAKSIRDAISNLKLREAGWRMNAEIVRQQADLDQNCERYMIRFRQLLREQIR